MKTILTAVTVAILATGCAGFKGTPLVGYQAGPGLPTITYERAVAASDFAACRTETRDGTIAVVRVPDSVNIDRQRRHKAGAQQVQALRNCMTAKGHTELVVVK